MLTRIEQWLFKSAPNQEEQKQLARILRVVLLAALAAFLLNIGFSIYWNHWWIVLASMIALVLLGIPYALLRHGHLRASANLVALDVLAVVTYSAIIGRGIYDIAFTAFPIIVLFAAMALNKKNFLFFVLVANGCIGFVAVIMFFGWFAPRPMDAEWITDTVFQMLATSMTALIAFLLAQNMRQNLKRARIEIAERNRTEAQLRQLSRAVEQSPASIVITNTQGVIEYVNPKFTEVTGYTLAEVRGQNPRILKSGEMPPEGYKAMWNTIIAGKEWRGEFHNKKKNGELYWESASISAITDANGEVTHFIAVKEDITARKQTESQLYYLSTHDIITALYNRAHFEAELERLESSRSYPVSIIVSDVDNMKTVNDSMGHAAGDELLKRIALVLRSAFRASDIVARIGGDEFAILLPDTDAVQADQALARVKEKLAEYQAIYPSLPLVLSIGAATSENGNLEETLKVADRRMYTDKRAHKQNDTQPQI